MERAEAGSFDSLVPTGNGDQVRLMRFDGKAWQPPLDVTEPGLNVWRPTVAVDGKGDVVIAWSQQIDGDWEIFYRRYTPPKNDGKGQWSNIVRLTNTPGSDFHVVAATDSHGIVWLAWQAWRNGQLRYPGWRPWTTSIPGRNPGPSPTARPTTGRPPSPPTRRAMSTSPGTPTTRATTTSACG